jgi:hypothetical protein
VLQDPSCPHPTQTVSCGSREYLVASVAARNRAVHPQLRDCALSNRLSGARMAGEIVDCIMSRFSSRSGQASQPACVLRPRARHTPQAISAAFEMLATELQRRLKTRPVVLIRAERAVDVANVVELPVKDQTTAEEKIAGMATMPDTKAVDHKFGLDRGV